MNQAKPSGGQGGSDAEEFAELDFSNAADLVESRQRFRRRPKKAENLLGQLMAHRGIAQQQSANELAEAWKIAAANFWKHTRLGNVRRGVLQVVVRSSAVMQQMSFEKHNILTELQARLPNNRIQDLRFQVGDVH